MCVCIYRQMRVYACVQDETNRAPASVSSPLDILLVVRIKNSAVPEKNIYLRERCIFLRTPTILSPKMSEERVSPRTHTNVN